ncbi:peptidase M48, partial [Oscillatoriales cyanobacterium LEGE 11467]|nr:peptidase M48 [Zarconia navalis LEGE 11467]
LVIDDLDPVMRSMMKLAGGSGKYGHEISLEEFVKQSNRYQELDLDSLNQIYKLLLYNGAQGSILSHPFPVDRISYLQQWWQSAEYRQIRTGNYQREGDGGSVEVSAAQAEQAESLRRQIDQLQQEIDRAKQRKSSS